MISRKANLDEKGVKPVSKKVARGTLLGSIRAAEGRLSNAEKEAKRNGLDAPQLGKRLPRQPGER